jgi:Arc/MetJ-type ribon-helix-helix transcriptional regulator
MTFANPDCGCVVVGDTNGMEACVCLPSNRQKDVAVAVVRGKEGKKVLVSGLDIGMLKQALQGRGNIVMTRIRDEDLEKIDVLVDAGLFDSRSEAAAFLIQQGIKAQDALYERVEETASRIRELKERMRKDLAA